MSSKKYCSGMAAISIVAAVAIIVVVGGIGIAGSGYIESYISSGNYDSKRALYAAEAGLQDAMKRVLRNRRCNEGATPSCTSYSLSVDGGVVSITVSGTNPKTIQSIGEVNSNRRTISVSVSYDANHKATYGAWQEVQ